jgi:hypothetical protein
LRDVTISANFFYLNKYHYHNLDFGSTQLIVCAFLFCSFIFLMQLNLGV